MDTVNESLTTADDGDRTVNERLSPGGEGPEGQPDTASESIATTAETAEPADETPVEEPKPKRTSKR